MAVAACPVEEGLSERHTVLHRLRRLPHTDQVVRVLFSGLRHVSYHTLVINATDKQVLKSLENTASGGRKRTPPIGRLHRLI